MLGMTQAIDLAATRQTRSYVVISAYRERAGCHTFDGVGLPLVSSILPGFVPSV